MFTIKRHESPNTLIPCTLKRKLVLEHYFYQYYCDGMFPWSGLFLFSSHTDLGFEKGL